MPLTDRAGPFQKHGCGPDGDPVGVPLSEYQTAIRDTTRLNQLFAILSEPAPVEVVVDRVLLALSSQFAADVVALLSSESPTSLMPVGAIGLPDEQMLRTFSCIPGSCAAEAIRTRAPALCNCPDDTDLDPQLAELDVKSLAWLPVQGADAVTGVLLLARCQSFPFSRSDGDLLMAMSHRIGLVLERARAEEERRRLETRLRHAEKSESLARMAAAVAHHFNNKLTAVTGYLELALSEVGTGADPTDDISRAREAANQASSVGQLMLAYLGQSLRTRRRLDLVSACRAVLPELERSLPSCVKLIARMPDGELTVRANRADIHQVLENLVANAAEALGEAGGDVTITIRHCSSGAVASMPPTSPGWTPSHADYACLEITDHGCGMDAPTLRDAFDPFFTTKFPGRGLGLPVALGLVKANDGAISVESSPGAGSTFRVLLPISLAGAVAGE
jgi:signal transduction histidine kinase